MRRGTVVAVTVAAAAVAAGGGWLAGRNVKSPDQAALESEPPPASLITVSVELAELTADVITRADVGYDEPASLRLAGALGDRESALVVTWAPERGAELDEGEPAIEIAGRPVFVISGDVPVYRDLRPQDQGPDVQQLETALVRLGYFDGQPDEHWDEATSEAVGVWYQTAGYRANGVSDAEEVDLRTARKRLDTTRDALRAAQMALDEALEGPTDIAVRQARTELAAARTALESDRLNAEGADKDAVQALADAEQAHENAVQALADAEQAVAAAEAAREEAAIRYGQAELRWKSAQAGVHPDTGEVPTAQQQEALRLASLSAGNALADAERAVGATVRGVEAAEVEVERRLLAIPSPQEQALSIDRARLAVQGAEDRLASAVQALEDMLSPVDATQARRSVLDARVQVAQAEKHLTQLEETTGVWLPAGEVIVLNRLPVRVDLLTAERGSTVSGAFMTVTGSKLAVRGSVSERDVDRVKQGAEAFIEDRSSSTPVSGTIRLVDQRSGTRGVASDRHYLEIVADGIPEDLVGRNVKVVIPVGGTDGTVLVVPTAALSAAADGSVRVEVERSGSTTDFVTVEPGLSTGGRVEVVPVDGELGEGDRVVVGVAPGSGR